MKKLLGILVLGLLWCGTSFATCTDQVEFEWDIPASSTMINDYRGSLMQGVIHFRFNNPTANTIMITWVALKTKDKTIMIEEDQNLIMQPFTKWNDIGIKKGNLMTDLAAFGSFRCRYVAAGTKNKKKGSKSKDKTLIEKIFGD